VFPGVTPCCACSDSLSLNPKTATALDTSLIIYYWLVCNIFNEKREDYVTKKNLPKSHGMMGL